MKSHHAVQPEPTENQFEFNECYIQPQFIIDEESVFNKLFDIFISKSLHSDGTQIGSLDYGYILALPVAHSSMLRYSNSMHCKKSLCIFNSHFCVKNASTA